MLFFSAIIAEPKKPVHELKKIFEHAQDTQVKYIIILVLLYHSNIYFGMNSSLTCDF